MTLLRLKCCLLTLVMVLSILTMGARMKGCDAFMVVPPESSSSFSSSSSLTTIISTTTSTRVGGNYRRHRASLLQTKNLASSSFIDDDNDDAFEVTSRSVQRRTSLFQSHNSSVHTKMGRNNNDSKRNNQFRLAVKSFVRSIRRILVVLVVCLATWSCGPFYRSSTAHATEGIHASTTTTSSSSSSTSSFSSLAIMTSSEVMADRFLVDSNNDDISLPMKPMDGNDDGGGAETITSVTASAAAAAEEETAAVAAQPGVMDSVLDSNDSSPDSTMIDSVKKVHHNPSRLFVKKGTTVLAMLTGAFVAVRRKGQTGGTNDTDNEAAVENDSTNPIEDGVSLTTNSLLPEDSMVPSDAGQQDTIPLMDRKYVEARKQPKSPKEEAALAVRYGAIDDVGERAYQILVDLGMVEVHP